MVRATTVLLLACSAGCHTPAPVTTDPAAAEAPGLCEDGEHRVGDTWKRECNTCHCETDGTVVCTRMACLDEPPA